MSAKDPRTAIEDAGLTVPSTHSGYNEFEARLDYAKELRTECAVCSMIPPSISYSVDGDMGTDVSLTCLQGRTRQTGRLLRVEISY